MRDIPGAWRRAARGAGLLSEDGSPVPTIFAEMSALAVATGAINLGQGFPDEDGPDEVLRVARQAIADGVNQYPPGRGILDLRQAVAEHQRRFYGLDLDPERDVLVTAGATEALAAALLAFVEDGEDEVVRLADRHDAIIVTDEVYEHLVFDSVHTPIATLPGAWARTLTISSGGKTFSTTGWKIGWVAGPSDLVDAVLAVKQFLTYVNGAPFQPAIATGLRLPDDFFRGAAQTLRAKRDLLGDGLRWAGFDVIEPHATYFTVADAAPLGATDAATFCRELPGRAGVVAIPMTAFVTAAHRDEYATLVRFAACKRLEVLEEAATRLAALA